MNKPWLTYYDREVPVALEYPHILIHQILEQTAARFPDRTALLFFGTSISYRSLQESVIRFAGALQKTGIKPKDRVALFLPNCPQMIIAFYAAVRIGATVVPTNPLYTDKELEFQLQDSGAETLITLDLLYARVNNVRARTPLQRIIVGKIEDYLPTLKKILYPF
ncbi:MAG: AMP-binding protein, partial [Proteobacteria bacterium]|nr:AMP-binding protein [Pseudomonadota bacterium]